MVSDTDFRVSNIDALEVLDSRGNPTIRVMVTLDGGMTATAEDDWAGFAEQTAKPGKRLQIVGDDIFVTNPAFIERGIRERTANAVLIKLNRIGTVTETVAAIEAARRAG